ncbi:MAG: hypothetical protein II007_00200 [Gammaproteobacteria bacterium]|nr:hypothetical protein [Gammaproteobacteria bacterium]
MKQTITWLALLPWAALSVTALADEAADARVTKLEQELAEVKARQDASSWTDRFKVNGFASVAVGTASNDAGFYGYDEDAEWLPDSVLGLQMTFNVNEQTEATVQLQARGADDWDPKIEWAFLAYTFDNGTKLRGGKLRLPLYMYSDYLEVGYAYPFARPSVDVYSLVPFSSYTGVDALIPVAIGDSTLTFQPFVGEASINSRGTYVDFKSMLGMVALLEYGNYTLRGIHGIDKLESDPNGPLSILNDIDSGFTGVAASYDNGDYFIIAEGARIFNEGAYRDVDSAYLALGYRFDAFTPYLVVGQSKSTDDDKRDGLAALGLRSSLDIRRTTVAAGLRWDFMPQLALKFDVTRASGFDGTTGGMASNEGVINIPGAGPTGINTATYDDTTIYSIVLDAVF